MREAPPHPRANPVIGGYSIPAGAYVVVSQFATHHQRAVPLDTEGITLRPKGPVPIRLAGR